MSACRPPGGPVAAQCLSGRQGSERALLDRLRGTTRAGLSGVDAVVSRREADCSDFSYKSKGFSFEKYLTKENSQKGHSAISLFYFGIIYVDRVPEIDPQAHR